MNEPDRQLLMEVRDLLKQALPMLADPEAARNEHEIIMMVSKNRTPAELQAAIKARNARIKASGRLKRRES
jgi:hypothetical protein